MAYPSAQEIITIVQQQRDFFNTLTTRPYEFRRMMLEKLKTGVGERETQFIQALQKDLGKSEFESYSTEIGFVLNEIRDILRHLRKWMRPRRRWTPMLFQPATSRVIPVPMGVNLIIAPFNYPMQLAIAPLAAAIAAGNTVILKPSELTPATGAVLQEMIRSLFEPKFIACLQGEVKETTTLLEQRFDHIFFTGSPAVGKIIMGAASKHLTPITLELGGKSPCIVHSDASLDIAVNRIVFGKFVNAGQTCIAPDYIMVQKDVEQRFLSKIKERIIQCFGDNPALSPDFGRMVNARHHRRVADLILPEKVVIGGQTDESDNYIAPTIMAGVTLDDAVMAQEIFGPVLPVLSYETLDQVYDTIAHLPQHPLACYIFTQSNTIERELVDRIQFGGASINHCLMHVGNLNLPFGGIGESGMGSYHGRSGFKQFSHKKSVLKAATWLDLPVIYPPYDSLKQKIIRLLLN